jgi:hypothetical protein
VNTMVENQDPDLAVVAAEKEDVTLLAEVQDLPEEKEQDPEPDPDHPNPLLNHQKDLHLLTEAGPPHPPTQSASPLHPQAPAQENPQDVLQTTPVKEIVTTVPQAQHPSRKQHQKATLSLPK